MSKKILLLLAVALAFPFSSAAAPKSLPVPALMYHYVRTQQNPRRDALGFGLSVTAENFEKQAAYLAQNGYHTITPEDLYQALLGQEGLPEKPVLLTFDDGYADFYTNAFPILQKYGLKATAFIVPGFLSDSKGRYMTWEQVKEIDASGFVTIGAHTMHHKDVTRPENLPEIAESKAALEKFLGHPVTAFAYPYGAFNDAAAAAVRDAGFDLAFTTRFGYFHRESQRFVLGRVRVSGGENMEHFVKGLTGKIPTSIKR